MDDEKVQSNACNVITHVLVAIVTDSKAQWFSG